MVDPPPGYDVTIKDPFPDNHALPNLALDVYVNNAPAFSYDPGRLPRDINFMSGVQDGLLPLDLFSFEDEYRLSVGERYKTPLDRYDFAAFVFVIDRSMNSTVPIDFIVGDTGIGDFVARFEVGTSKNTFAFTTLYGDDTVAVEVESYTTHATVRRTARAKALTFLMFTINWLLTLCTSIITLIVASRGMVKDSIALLPVSIIFSVPSIRALYLDSPPFGIFIDMVGFFPQMIIAVGCGVIVLFVSVLDKPDTGTGDPGNNDPAKGNIGKYHTSGKAEVSPEVP